MVLCQLFVSYVSYSNPFWTKLTISKATAPQKLLAMNDAHLTDAALAEEFRLSEEIMIAEA